MDTSDNAEISNIQEATAGTTAVLEAEPSTSADGAISTPLFRLEEEERRNMEQLFQNALSVGSRERNADIDILQEQSNSNSEGEEEEMKDKLRSAKRTLQWNPEMNGDTVVMESK